MITAEQRDELQKRIVDALDDDIPIHVNIAALAMVLCQAAHLARINKQKFIHAMSATYDVAALQEALRSH